MLLSLSNQYFYARSANIFSLKFMLILSVELVIFDIPDNNLFTDLDFTTPQFLGFAAS